MKQVAQPHPLVEWRDGSAEDTKLPNNSVDLVTCFQAFHWFNPEPTLKEFARILKPGGILAAIWNNRARQDRFTKEYSRLTQIASQNQSEMRYGTEKFLRDTNLFSLRHLIFPYYQILDCKALIGTVSTSYILQQGAVAAKFIQDLEQLCDRHKNSDGLVYLKYNTSVYLTTL